MEFKKILATLTVALAISMTTITAQPGGGGMGGPGGGMGGPGGGMGPGGPQSSASIDPVAMTGYFEMDVEKVIKKIKVKEEAEKSEIRKAFADFNVGSADVFVAHPTEFQNLEAMKEMIESAQMGSMDESTRNNMREMMSGTMVIKSEMLVLHKALKAEMESILASNEKSFKRWELYYADVCDTNNFSEKERERGQRGQGGQGGRPEGGMGGPEGGMGGGPGGF